MNEEQNLTTGSVPGKLIVFALHLLFANLLQSFYSIVDMLVVGRIVGNTGLAAISNASMAGFIINSVCIGLTTVSYTHLAAYPSPNPLPLFSHPQPAPCARTRNTSRQRVHGPIP